jgi:hypothetical protein
MSEAIPPLPNTPLWRGAQLKQKHRDNFTFTFKPVSTTVSYFCFHGIYKS